MKEWIMEECPALTLDGKIASTMLRREQELIRCKDCKKRYTVLCIQEEAGNINNQDDWFCADGIAKDTDVLNK